MPELRLLLKNEREENLEGWTVADAHYDLQQGVAVLVIVSPEQRELIEWRGADQMLVDMIGHCADVVVKRNAQVR